MTRLLLVEDDAQVQRLVGGYLEREGLNVTSVGTVASALAELHRTCFDVVVLDLALPDGSGFDVLRTLRSSGVSTHVIILSGAQSQVDRVRGLALGADDYVVKPFFVRELAARVLAAGRRHDLARVKSLRSGGLTIDITGRRVTVGETEVRLSTKEFDLLAFLAARPRHAFSRDELLRSVWQSADDLQREATVTEHVRRLRSKIEMNPRDARMLQTVRGVGYRFDPQPADQSN
jgi:DNA-binding response OmpR family regulator